jgi:phytoene desaturase
MARVGVIGAGIGGLAVAARLAAQGHRVEVFERAATHGGKVGQYRRDGYVFDTGPSLLTMPGTVEEVFAGTGGPADLDVQPVDPAVGYRFPDGRQLVVPHDPAAVPEAVGAALGPGAAAAWSRLYRRSAGLWDLVGEPVLQRPMGVRDLARFSMRASDLRLIAPWRTLRGLGRGLLPDPRLRMWLDRYATYSGSDPRRLPSVLSVTAYVEQRFGAWYLRGGVRQLADALLLRCTELGVGVHLGAAVVRVETAGATATGLLLADGRRVAADIVVCNADASVLYERLLPPMRATAWTRRALRRATPSLAGFVLLLALDGREPAEAAHRVYFPADYDAEFDAVFGRRARPVPDPTIYVHAPDDPALRPHAASEGWFVLVNAPRHGIDGTPGTVDWTAAGLAERYAAHVLDVLERRGVRVRHRLRWCETRTPADLERDTAAPGGAIYGTAVHGGWAALLRPRNATPVRGLYLVGGSTHPGGGLPLVLNSAAIVAELVGARR